MAEESTGPDLRDDLKWGAAVMLVVILATSAVTAGLWDAAPEGRERMTGETVDGETQPGLTDAIFHQYVVAFEILGVLLLASLVGAIVIAVREDNL